MIQPNYWGVVMLSKGLHAVVWATVLSAGLAGAQSLAQIGGPANLPPAGFTGQQFVDNRGCLFLKAGYGATVNWVPRVDRRHMPLCGFPPTFGAAVIAAVEADMAPDPEARVVVAAPVAAAKPVVVAAAPQAQVAAPAAAPRKSLMEVLFGSPATASPARPATARPTYVAADLAGPASGQIACWPAAPKLERVLLRAGGTALVCTRGDGTLTGWLPPGFPQGAGTGAALTGPRLTPGIMAGASLIGGTVRTVAATTASNAIPTPPKGYKLAWEDDRLNPMRGVGTATGQAQQDAVWTRTVPAVLVTAAPTAKAALRAQVTVSTMSAPQATEQAAPAVQARPAAQGGASYVQVGTFGQPANAEGVKARLKALGLPVSTAKITSKGKVLQVVYAGPFRSAADAQAALGMARGAGFGDAILK